MADIIPPGFAQVTVPLAHQDLTRAAAVVFGIEVPGGGVDPDLLAADVQSSFVTSIGQGVDSQVLIGPVTVLIGQDGGEGIAGSSPSGQQGAANLTAPPPNVAVLLRKRTARGGRRGRGRMYLPWWCQETDIDEAGRLTGAAISSRNTAANLFLNTLSGADTPMVILHSQGRTTPGQPNLVTTLTCDPVVATQRRRLVR